MTSFLIEHRSCPKCKKEGRDRNNDNLGIYSDGHQFCFSCKYFVPANKIENFKKMKDIEERVEDCEALILPYDVTPYIPRIPKEWLESYSFNENTILNNNILWSPSRELLIFPFFIGGDLAAWQGRYFGLNPKHPKWYSSGKLLDALLYTRGKQTDTIVLVEDIVSAIRVGKVQTASHLFGSVISDKKCSCIKRVYKNVIIWLDYDKRSEAVEYRRLLNLYGINASVIITEKDPKTYTTEEITEYINNATRTDIT